jgi:S1-C subfamily serine protease
MSRILGLGISGIGLLAVMLSSQLTYAGSKVIYGEDDRRDLYDSRNDPRFVELAKSTAIVVKRTDLELDGPSKSYHLPMDTFGSMQNLCASEPFFDQPSPGFCSGFLVGADLFVTAGHCIRSADLCSGTSFVFNFGYDHQGRDLNAIEEDDVYHCQSIVAQKLEGGTGRDYAVVKLDRPVVGREPVKLRRSGVVRPGEGVTVIGHPSGLPTKITSGAKVRVNAADAPYFVANLDTYGGNSGSAVFNTATGEVEGILVRGETDFVYQGGCAVSNHCAEGACRGEDVSKASTFIQYIPAN